MVGRGPSYTARVIKQPPNSKQSRKPKQATKAVRKPKPVPRHPLYHVAPIIFWEAERLAREAEALRLLDPRDLANPPHKPRRFIITL